MGSYDGTLTLLENRDGIFVPVDGGTPWGKPADAWTTGLGAILLPNFTHPALAELDEDGHVQTLSLIVLSVAGLRPSCGFGS